MPTNCHFIPIADLFADPTPLRQLTTPRCEVSYFIFYERIESIILGNSGREVPARSQLTVVAESDEFIGQPVSTVARAIEHPHTTPEKVETNT